MTQDLEYDLIPDLTFGDTVKGGIYLWIEDEHRVIFEVLGISGTHVEARDISSKRSDLGNKYKRPFDVLNRTGPI